MAAKGALAATLNAGQDCAAATRLVVAREKPERYRGRGGALAGYYYAPTVIIEVIQSEVFGPALRLAAQLEFGTVWINDHLPLTSEPPHGGFKPSGCGKEL